jgi:hypothetical protein
MKIVILIIVLSIITFLVYRFIKVRIQNRKINQQRFDRIKPLYDRLENGEKLTQQDVYEFAKNIPTREMTYRLLHEHNMIEIFPQEFISIIKAAESYLANWLEFPTELDAFPDEMEHIKRVTFDFDGQNNFVYYEVFKYRVNEPHWAAKDGWILGVVGPYFDDSKPYDNPEATFSRVSSRLETTTPDEEAKWVHEHISIRR